MEWKKLWLRILPALLLVAVAAGCRSVQNNYLQPEDFAEYLKRDGIQVESVQPLPGEPFRATGGCGIVVDGNEIGVYKYDLNSEIQRKRLARIAEAGRIYIVGIPFPVEVSGSFVFMGLEKNKQKSKILKTIDKFH